MKPARSKTQTREVPATIAHHGVTWSCRAAVRIRNDGSAIVTDMASVRYGDCGAPVGISGVPEDVVRELECEAIENYYAATRVADDAAGTVWS